MAGAEQSAAIAAMASVLTAEDVEANNTILVLLRHGWRCREIEPVIDRVESVVRERPAMLAGIIALPVVTQLSEAA